MSASYLVLGLLCGLAIGYAFGWQSRTRRPRTDRNDRPDCDGPAPCSTCQDKRECGKTGCVRQGEFISSEFHARQDAVRRIRAGIAADRCDGDSEYAAGVNAACRNHLALIDRALDVASPEPFDGPARQRGLELLRRAKKTAVENAAREAWNAHYFKCAPQVSLELWTLIWKKGVQWWAEPVAGVNSPTHQPPATAPTLKDAS